MTAVTRIPATRSVPELSVFELGVARARSCPAVSDCEQFHACPSGWFLQDVRIGDVEDAMLNMTMRAFLVSGQGVSHPCRLTDEGSAAVTTLYGGCIRMIDRIPAIYGLLPTTGDTGNA
ncbi:hypothetical protein [Novosphingobium gossypii]|uniref:hypothetical protein n=1 Tax=Novosphingobium gossypii TaxID=1604774 RepID=UPI003D23A4D8